MQVSFPSFRYECVSSRSKGRVIGQKALLVFFCFLVETEAMCLSLASHLQIVTRNLLSSFSFKIQTRSRIHRHQKHTRRCSIPCHTIHSRALIDCIRIDTRENKRVDIVHFHRVDCPPTPTLPKTEGDAEHDWATFLVDSLPPIIYANGVCRLPPTV